MSVLGKKRTALCFILTALLASCSQKLATEETLDKLLVAPNEAPSQCHFLQKTEPYTLLPNKADPLVRLIFAFWFGDREITDFKKGFSNIFHVEGQTDRADQMITLGLLFVDEQSAKSHEEIVNKKYRYSSAHRSFRQKNLLLLMSRRDMVSDACFDDYYNSLVDKIK